MERFGARVFHKGFDKLQDQTAGESWYLTKTRRSFKWFSCGNHAKAAQATDADHVSVAA
jgi:hypothetical protein